MIAELFYPKELKDIIADLRAKGDLNEEALENINRDAITKKAVLLILSGISMIVAFSVTDEAMFVALSACSAVFIILTLLPVTGLNCFIMPYACGVGTVGEIIGAQYEIIPYHGYKGWNINYEFFDQKGFKHTGNQVGICREDVNNRKVEAGDEIEIYYALSKPSKSVPLLRSRYFEYSIRKTLPLCDF